MSLLSLKLNDVDTSFPRLTGGDYVMNISEASIVDGKEVPSNQNLKLVFETTSVAQDHKGSDIDPGFKITRYYPIPNEGREADKNDMFMKGLTLLALAVCGYKDTPENKAALPDFDEEFISNMVGKQVLAKVKDSKPKEGDEYGPKSEVASVRCIPA